MGGINKLSGAQLAALSVLAMADLRGLPMPRVPNGPTNRYPVKTVSGDPEVQAWNEAVEKRKADKKARKARKD